MGNPTESPQDEAKRYREAAKYSYRKDDRHLSDLANRGKWHHFKCLWNCIVCNRESFILRSILGFKFILQNDIIPCILCHGRVSDRIRPEYLYNSVWTSLALAESTFTRKNTTIELWSDPYCLTDGLDERIRSGAEKWIRSPWQGLRSESGDYPESSSGVIMMSVLKWFRDNDQDMQCSASIEHPEFDEFDERNISEYVHRIPKFGASEPTWTRQSIAFTNTLTYCKSAGWADSGWC
jgi:hypothetical protein